MKCFYQQIIPSSEANLILLSKQPRHPRAGWSVYWNLTDSARAISEVWHKTESFLILSCTQRGVDQIRSAQLTGVHLEPERILYFWMHSLWPRCCIHPCLQNIPQTTMADTEIPAVSVDTLPGCIFPHLHKYFILFYLCKKLNMLIWKLEKKIFFTWDYLNSKVLYYLSFKIHSFLKIKTTYLYRIVIILVIFKTVKNKIKLDIFQSYFFRCHYKHQTNLTSFCVHICLKFLVTFPFPIKL